MLIFETYLDKILQLKWVVLTNDLPNKVIRLTKENLKLKKLW